MIDNKQARKTLERTTNCDIRIDNTLRYNQANAADAKSRAADQPRYESNTDLGDSTHECV